MKNFRFFVEKKCGFNLESKRILSQFQNDLKITNLNNVRIINCYGLFNLDCTENEIEKIKKLVLSEVVTDTISEEIDLDGKKYFAVSLLPGQFDQRADSTSQAINLICEKPGNFSVQTFRIIILEGNLSNQDLEKIKKFYINPIESCEKDLGVFQEDKLNLTNLEKIKKYDDFINKSREELEKFLNDTDLSININDIIHIQNYFKSIDRNPTETEIKVLDTYWSDHCRHSTFETQIKDVHFPDTKFGDIVKSAYERYLNVKKENNITKKICLMDIGTIVAKELKNKGMLDDLEISEENNACSVYIDVDVEDFDGKLKKEKWLLMFKNETHNHPTEIEPFGGASTCLGGAIRDPLSGRAYVYQAIRVTGSANPLEDVSKTLEGKLSQKKITTGAAHGYSSYGNQIGIATGHVAEIYHEGYKAKRMEVGAVVAAAPLENVIRSTPKPGDSIIIIGGKTGRDGCGGATGSSKKHNVNSLLNCGAEVQKGNAPEERKIQRLFRNKDATTLIKKCNDFGAGGVSVAIGELSSGVFVDLNLVKTKYSGLNGTELAISESQERMAVVVDKINEKKFLDLAISENLEATVVGEITDNDKLILSWNGENIVDIDRKFLDTNGAPQEITVKVSDRSIENIFNNKNFNGDIKESWFNNLSDLNQASQKGLVEMFDSTIGASTVLMPFGGIYQMSPTDVSISKIPMINSTTDTASAITWGYNPNISSLSEYHGGYYAVIESVSKLVAAGVNYKGVRLSFQEYFEKLGNDPYRWGKPFVSLLGAFDAQRDLDIAAIGGKDSMSGSFNEIDVPPTLISFAVNTVKANDVISTDFKKSNNYIYLFDTKINDEKLVDITFLKKSYNYILNNINSKIISAMAIKNGGISEAISKMSFGNKIGFELKTDIDLFLLKPGAILVESVSELDFDEAILIGKTTNRYVGKVNEIEIDLNLLEKIWLNKLSPVFSYEFQDNKNVTIYNKIEYKTDNIFKSNLNFAKPKVLIAAFPGTNCEIDTANIFEKNGAKTNITLFKNINQNLIKDSIMELKTQLLDSQIFVLPGGFSLGDEPDGSGKFISIVLQNEEIKNAIEKFLERDGLILGICNGFQALIKSGLLPYGEIGKINDKSPTLTFNKIGRHISQIVKTRISSNNSPWLNNMEVGEIFDIAVSHGEGRFFASDEIIKNLEKNGQIATQYVDLNGNPTDEFKYNPNGSTLAIEGILSPDGKIFGKMGHSERTGENIFKNIYGNKYQNIFLNGINYFK